ncbi:MAG: hypothetical protein AAB489_03200 [Patescibacteria group bacterium]
MEKQTKVIVGFGFVLAAFAATLLLLSGAWRALTAELLESAMPSFSTSWTSPFQSVDTNTSMPSTVPFLVPVHTSILLPLLPPSQIPATPPPVMQSQPPPAPAEPAPPAPPVSAPTPAPVSPVPVPPVQIPPVQAPPMPTPAPFPAPPFPVPPVPTPQPTECGGDGVDNDNDGDADEPDESCISVSQESCESDGMDNNGDGSFDEPGESCGAPAAIFGEIAPLFGEPMPPGGFPDTSPERMYGAAPAASKSWLGPEGTEFRRTVMEPLRLLLELMRSFGEQ